jgi:2-keto-4-pentenoate hydratase/2-oxohepta-3-ene-1,7-dioic acid hydratase in catechol pathway
MQLLTFVYHGTHRLGIRLPHGVVDVGAATAAFENVLGDVQLPGSVTRFFQGGGLYLEGLQKLSALASETSGEWLLTEDSLTLGAAVPAPGKIICIGLNYRRHAEESKLPVPTTPILFSKYQDTIAAHNEAIPFPKAAVEIDYEAELVAVIGKEARNVSEAEALDYVLGYCNGNDVSARDLQMKTSQWLLGKTLEKFMPIGPYLVTADEVGDPQALGIRLWLNGELRQNSNTSDMVFSVAEVISYISQYIPLQPGDIISTGTPEGVILGMAEKKWMQPGDQMTVEIDRLGALTNTLI